MKRCSTLLIIRNGNQNHSKVTPHTGQNGHYKKIYKQLKLERVWRKGNTLAVLVGMQIDTDTVEDNMEIS